MKPPPLCNFTSLAIADHPEGCVSVNNAGPLRGLFIHSTLTTMSVTFPAPLVTNEQLDNHVLTFLLHNPEGVRNTDVGRAIGYNDSRQWFSYGVLERLIRNGLAEKRTVKGRSLYFLSQTEQVTSPN